MSSKWKAQNEWKKRNPERHAAYALASYYRNHESRKQRNRDRYNKNRDKYCKSMNTRRYGMTPVEYDALFVKQDGVCALCGQEDKGNRHLAIDHCHETGKIRALLCGSCNGGLGLFSDDVAMLEKAIVYLKSHQQTKQQEVIKCKI